jgi:glycosyltransferase involved in cell wall biosynthesis
VTNSNRTSADVQELGISSQKIRRVYFGATRPPEDNEVALGDERTLLFLGALGWDSRKGLDTLIEAFAVLCRDPGFRHRLVIAGNGVREPWARLASVLGVEGRVDFVGFSHSPEALIRRADLVLSPVRYEPYGLALQEAICAGVPILVSRDAGFVERMDTASEIMTVPSDASVVEWVERVASALQNLELLRAKARRLASRLLERSWTDFAREFIEVVESAQR